MVAKIPKEVQIEKMKTIHSNRYDYSLSEFTKSSDKIDIYCKKHDIWFVNEVMSHVRGTTGCQQCKTEKINKKQNQKTQDTIKKRLRYLMILDESFESPLRNYSEPQKFKCLYHGVFEIYAWCQKSYCPECMEENRKKEMILKIANRAYERSNGNLFIPLCQNVNHRSNQILKNFCNKHKKWNETYSRDLNRGKSNCSDCCLEGHREGARKLRSNNEELIQKFKEVHGDYYDYTKFDWKNKEEPIIICPFHGEFTQDPSEHLRGGCKKCNKNGVYDDYYFLKNPQKKNDKGVLYLLEVILKDKKFLKLGISVNLKGRKRLLISQLKKYSENPIIKTLKEAHIPLYETYRIEQKTIERYNDNLFDSDFRFSGWTECMCIEKKEEVLDFIDQELIEIGL